MIVATFSKTIYDYYTKLSTRDFEGEGIEFKLIPKLSEEKEICDVLISGTLDRKQLTRFPNLTCVAVPYTGMDGLDVDELRKRHITIINTSAHGHFVAERAVALLLALQGKLITCHNGLVNKKWHRSKEENQSTWVSVYKKKVGIYGYGTIGKEVGKLLKPWQVSLGVLAYKSRHHKGIPNFETLEQLCDWCDILIITAPLNSRTKGSMDDDILKTMTGKYLVNVGPPNTQYMN